MITTNKDTTQNMRRFKMFTVFTDNNSFEVLDINPIDTDNGVYIGYDDSYIKDINGKKILLDDIVLVISHNEEV